MRRFFVTLAMIAVVLAPLGARASDRQIAEQIVRGLKQHKASGKLEGFNIDLQVEEGAVRLTGHVSTPQQAQLAVESAREVAGVKKVINEIEVRSKEQEPKPSFLSDLLGKAIAKPTGTARLVSGEEELTAIHRDSQEIAQELAAKLKTAQKEGQLHGFGIDAEVDNGVLRLKGTVSSAEQQTLVLETARRIQGVTKVINALSVEQPIGSSVVTRVEDASVPPVEIDEMDSQDIAQQVLSQLQKHKDLGKLRGFGIDVEVDNGVVWMSGHVADAQQQALALNIARYIKGVKQVVNDLTVMGEEPSPLPTRLTQATAPIVQEQPAQSSRQIVGWRLVPASSQQPAASQPAQASVQTPLAFAPARAVNHTTMIADGAQPIPSMGSFGAGGVSSARFDHPQMPNYSWPSYASYPNYGAVTYPQQYSAAAWPYIGPFYPYPQVPLGWRKVTLEWDDGWWQLDFKDRHYHY